MQRKLHKVICNSNETCGHQDAIGSALANSLFVERNEQNKHASSYNDAIKNYSNQVNIFDSCDNHSP
jgi:hypothetical protein